MIRMLMTFRCTGGPEDGQEETFEFAVSERFSELWERADDENHVNPVSLDIAFEKIQEPVE